METEEEWGQNRSVAEQMIAKANARARSSVARSSANKARFRYAVTAKEKTKRSLGWRWVVFWSFLPVALGLITATAYIAVNKPEALDNWVKAVAYILGSLVAAAGALFGGKSLIDIVKSRLSRQ